MSKRIILKENWDLPPKILLEKGKEKENFKGYFVGRERDIDECCTAGGRSTRRGIKSQKHNRKSYSQTLHSD